MDHNEQWTFEVGDFAYIVEDSINIYTMVEDGSYTIEWFNEEARVLGASTMAASLLAAASVIAFTSF